MLLQAVLSENEALKSELAEMKFLQFSTYTCGYEALTGAFFINL